MRVGVMSDTHDNARSVRRMVELLNGAGVERVIHTGDITRPPTLELLAALRAPLVGVFGNNDVDRGGLAAVAARQGFRLEAGPLELDWHGRRIAVVHDPEEHALDLDGLDVLVHGHHHRRVIERVGRTLVFNPGECAGWLDGHNAVGVLDLERIEAEVLRF